jgi:Flp pilus assembly protein TadD
MPTSRFGGIAAFTTFGLLLVAVIGTDAYLAYRVAYPPRVVRVRIAADPANPVIPGLFADEMKARVESLSGVFERAAGIRLVVTGVARLELPSKEFDPVVLGRFLDVRTPRENADILVAFWAAPPGDRRLGSALPFRGAVVSRIEPDNKQLSQAILAHQLLTAFGVPVSSDPQSVMNVPPTVLRIDSTSREALMDTRRFDFTVGLGSNSRRSLSGVLKVVALDARLHPDATQRPGEVRSARVRLAEYQMRDSQFAAAANQYRAEIRADSGNLAAHFGLVQALTRGGQLADAETEARATLKLAPDRAESHYGLASVLVRRGDPEAAIPEFKRAIAIQPDGIRNRTGLAVAYAASIGEFDEADREFQAALKIDSQNPVLLADMDYVHRLRARLTHQLELAETALKEHPERGVTRSQVALLLVRGLKAGARHVADALYTRDRAVRHARLQRGRSSHGRREKARLREPPVYRRGDPLGHRGAACAVE